MLKLKALGVVLGCYVTFLMGICDFAGSSHSDKEVDANTPEKVPRTATERKRKRKADDGGGGVSGGPAGSKGARSVAALDNKKINEYFPKHHLGNSPIRHGGAKSPSPQQGYSMVSSRALHVELYLTVVPVRLFLYGGCMSYRLLHLFLSLPTVSTIASTVTFTPSNDTQFFGGGILFDDAATKTSPATSTSSSTNFDTTCRLHGQQAGAGKAYQPQ